MRAPYLYCQQGVDQRLKGSQNPEQRQHMHKNLQLDAGLVSAGLLPNNELVGGAAGAFAVLAAVPPISGFVDDAPPKRPPVGSVGFAVDAAPPPKSPPPVPVFAAPPPKSPPPVVGGAEAPPKPPPPPKRPPVAGFAERHELAF